jgi:predicted alpha-1,6-mannanase (GH76 family)
VVSTGTKTRGTSDQVNSIANELFLSVAAHLAKLAPDGILTEPGCDNSCNDDGQFKGVFIQNLQILQQASPAQAYAAFLLKMPTAYERTIGVATPVWV